MAGHCKTLAVLGLDAMPWSHLYRLLEEGVMPYTKQLLQKTFNAVLEAYPPATPPSWSSIMTGVNPGKHGIYGFFRYHKGTWSQRLYNAYDLKHPRLHEMLSMLGRRSIVFNPIPDYPIIPARNAEVVSNLFFTPKPLSHPAGAHKRYFGGENPQRYTYKVTCEVVEDYVRVAELYLAALEKASARAPSLLWVTLNAPDILFHRCPGLLGGRPGYGEEKVFGLVDKMVRLLDENFDSLMIVSDHGFTRYDRLVSVNDILVRHGLASTTNKPGFFEVAEYKERHGLVNIEKPVVVKVPPSLYRAVKKLRAGRLVRAAVKLAQRMSGKKVIFSTARWVDKEKSLAAMPEHYAFGVLVKDKSRVAEVAAALRSYPGYISVSLPGEVYSGPYVDEAPDIVVFPRFDRGYWVTSNIIGSITARGEYYAHHPEGVLVARSDELQHTDPEDVKMPNYGVATLALHMLGLPLPKSRDRHRLVEEVVAGDPEYNYLSRWDLMLRVAKARRKVVPRT